ncbi:hypothetical protein DAI22_02g134950 [Oryza sativa Japonica Group]|nr:hypothetical protein DAI22_02g134950 [Oryza sativa Japonica Group]
MGIPLTGTRVGDDRTVVRWERLAMNGSGARTSRATGAGAIPVAACRRPFRRPPPSPPPPPPHPLLLLHRPRGIWWCRRTVSRHHSQRHRRSSGPPLRSLRSSPPTASAFPWPKATEAVVDADFILLRAAAAPGRAPPTRPPPSLAPIAGPGSCLLTLSPSGRVATTPSPSSCHGRLRQPSAHINSFRRPLALCLLHLTALHRRRADRRPDPAAIAAPIAA